MSIEFWAKLIKVLELTDSIRRNCTHVVGDYWIFEGDEDALEGRFEILAEGSVPSLGGLSLAKLIPICNESFGIDLIQDEWPVLQVALEKKGWIFSAVQSGGYEGWFQARCKYNDDLEPSIIAETKPSLLRKCVESTQE